MFLTSLFLVNIQIFTSNLFATDRLGNLLWHSEIPGEYRKYGYYHDVEIIDGELIAWFGGSFKCKIDLASGVLLNVKFVK